MSVISPEILKPCDIRGIYPKPLGAPQAEQVGLAVGTMVKEAAHRNIKVVVGRDVRNSGEGLNKALIQGLRNTGLKIVDAGMVSTPLLAFATRLAGASVGIMITASHNPGEYNGFKFFNFGEPASTQWVEGLYRIIRSQTFRKGAGVVEKKNFFADYRNALVNVVAQNFQNFKIVLDAGNGTAALTAPMVLQALNCDLTVLNGDPDGDYPGRGADSSEPAGLAVLGEKVRRAKAQMGVSFDGDADRVSFVDEKGREVPNDVMLCLFAEDLLRKRKGLKVVYDGKCSDCVEKMVLAEGGVPLLEKSGHSFIYSRMTAEKAALGGEASGHFFLPGSFPGDALFACLRVLEILKENRKTLGEFFSQFPQRVSSHDIKLEIQPETAPQLYEILKARAENMGGEVSAMDGVRAIFKDGWGIVRMSVTQPYLTCRLEASNLKKLREMAGEWFQDNPEMQKLVLKKIKEA